MTPASQNPLLEPDEEYTHLDGDEEAAEMYNRMSKPHEGPPCVFCEHGGCRRDAAASELQDIHDLEEEHYGTIADPQLFKWIAEEYKARVYDPCMVQNEAKKARGDKLAKDEEEIRLWTADDVARHYEREGLYLHRELGKDIRTCSAIQDQLRFHGIVRRNKQGEKVVDVTNAKLWKLLSQHKSELITRMGVLYPSIAKRQKAADKPQK